MKNLFLYNKTYPLIDIFDQLVHVLEVLISITVLKI